MSHYEQTMRTIIEDIMGTLSQIGTGYFHYKYRSWTPADGAIDTYQDLIDTFRIDQDIILEHMPHAKFEEINHDEDTIWANVSI